jgi:hypothetical protein
MKKEIADSRAVVHTCRSSDNWSASKHQNHIDIMNATATRTNTARRIRTNSKQVREVIRQHILECVTDGNGDTYAAFEDARQRLVDEFDRVANYPHNLRRIPNAQNRFRDYLMGIPFGFEYTNCGISDFLNSLGINPENKEFDPGKSAKLYACLIFREMTAPANL